MDISFDPAKRTQTLTHRGLDFAAAGDVAINRYDGDIGRSRKFLDKHKKNRRTFVCTPGEDRNGKHSP